MSSQILINLDDEGNAKAFMHEPLGVDNLIATSVAANIGVTGLEDQMALALYKTRFGMIIALTESVMGLDYELPPRNASSDALTEGFVQWLQLPEGVFRRWFDAPEDLKGSLNNPALLPAARVPEKLGNDPLPEGSAKSKQKS